ncbi:SH3 domain-containing protein 19 isoform 2-T2 [Menidia menidia]
MMAEALRGGEEEEERQRRGLGDTGLAADPERNKPGHPAFSQGPLSSLRAAIKRTRTSSQSDNNRERRRPEITIISAEPLVSSNWFSGHSVVFHPSQPLWTADIQTAPQVIKEKNQEVHTVKPTAAPRRISCTATSATQTDPFGEDSKSHNSPSPATRKPGGKNPQKPPRPSLPKEKYRKPASVTGEEATTKTLGLTNIEHQIETESVAEQKEESSHTCTRSVTVHWDISTDYPSVTAGPVENTFSNSVNSQRPIPRPRTKTHKQEKEKAKVQTLVKLSDSSENTDSYFQDNSTNKYLQDLLEVFGGDNKCQEKSDTTYQSEEGSRGEDAVSEMNTNHSQRNIQARIQAFESQASSKEEDVLESAKPEPVPRKTTPKPPVAAKPSVALKPKSFDDNNQNMPTTQNPTPAPRPQPPKKPVGHSVREELETLHSKGVLQPRSRPSVFTRGITINEEEQSQIPPAPPVKPSKEPLKPNLNINNHNSASMFRNNEDPLPENTAIKPQHVVDSSEISFTRQSVTRRPTTIRVPSKTGSNLFQDSPPPLPVQKPVGTLNSSVNFKQSSIPTVPFQSSFSTGTEPPLPPRKPTANKTLPPRPPPAKTAPGRPPPPNPQSTFTPQSASRQPSSKPKAQKPQRKSLVLPRRPSPGHRLYNKYTLQLPHGIAATDYNGSNTGELSFQKNEVLLLLEKINQNEFECQVGEVVGKVHKSRMQIITPLESHLPPPQEEAAPASGRTGNAVTVQALYDFTQEGPGELGLRAGDVVTEVEQVDSQWYRGTCRGATGYFPVNFVKVLSNSPKPIPERKAKAKSAPVSGPRCVARFDFEGEHSDELSFLEGDVIQLKEYVGEDWARGQVGVAMGIFPINFVEIIEDLPPPSQQQSDRIALPGLADSAPSKQPVAATPAQVPESKMEWVVALYDYTAKAADDLSFQEGDCILITKHISEEWSCGMHSGREGMFPMAFVKSTTGPQPSKNKPNGEAGGRRARALFDFTSHCEEELSFQVGDVITNLESMDEEWFLGDLRGTRALVPKNYVQVL